MRTQCTHTHALTPSHAQVYAQKNEDAAAWQSKMADLELQ